MMKKKVWFNLCDVFVTIGFSIMSAGGSILISYMLAKANYTIQYVMFPIAILLCMGMCIWGIREAVYSAGNMIIFDDKIQVKYKGWHKYTEIYLTQIREVVLVRSEKGEPSGNIIIKVNSKKGAILGYGKKALYELQKAYPQLKFRVKCISRILGKKNAILLAQHGNLGKYKLEQIKKMYHLRDDTLFKVDPDDE